MVRVETIKEIRPKFDSDFSPGKFVPRTGAIAEAYRWGKEIHQGQLRMSGEPYFETHCAWVAGLIDQLAGVEAWTIAALLHDSVEDQEGSLDKIRQHFPGMLGMEVAHIVDGVTKISNPRDGSSRDLETLRKIARFRDPGVFLVKLADKSHNVLTLEHMPEQKRISKASEAIRAYGKLAGILNCYRWRRWLEDMAFPHAEPDTYSFVRQRIDSDARLKLEFVNNMIEQLGSLMEKAGLSGKVSLTVNGYWQSWQKIRRMARLRKSSMDSFEALNDMVSFRMILDDPDPIHAYTLLSYINRFFGPYLDQNRFDDYIAHPQNGYRALQVTIWRPEFGAIEIAIATEEMEGENTWGVIYALKQGKDISDYRPVEIFTPTGGARFLPEGSSVLDAVASIQQEFLLDKISGVKVNGNLAKLSDKVKPGDVVEVITNVTRMAPESDWLKFVNPATSRLLRSVLAVEDLRKAAENGKQLIKKLLNERGILALEDVQALYPEKINQLLETTSAANLQDFYAAVGSGAIRLVDMAKDFDEIGLGVVDLNWTTINIQSGSYANRPGVLAKLAGLISDSGGNIVRSVNNTMPDGGFYLRLVVENLEIDKETFIKEASEISGINKFEIGLVP
ncbi:MAG TPA: HD domain-containing protein [Anaerolineaceae bacterium]|nr:HD domain-containing protein [Anaerolineaceae bacterium]